MLLAVALAALGLTAFADYYWTEKVVRNGGFERNPILARCMATPWHHAAAKIVLVSASAALIGYSYPTAPAAALAVTAGAAAALATVAWSNRQVYARIQIAAAQGR